jgi:hypothetical protein
MAKKFKPAFGIGQYRIAGTFQVNSYLRKGFPGALFPDLPTNTDSLCLDILTNQEDPQKSYYDMHFNKYWHGKQTVLVVQQAQNSRCFCKFLAEPGYTLQG